jgi:NADPH2:quinone reductase
VRINRVMFRNVSLVGAAYGAFVERRPDVARATADAVAALVARGAIRPLVTARFPLARAADALRLVEARRALGKIVVDVEEAG